MQINGPPASGSEDTGGQVRAGEGRTSLVRMPSADGFLPSHRVLRPEGGSTYPLGRLFLLHGFFGALHEVLADLLRLALSLADTGIHRNSGDDKAKKETKLKQK